MGLTGEDVAHLERCLALADRGARTAAPNPLVGCVIVRDGVVLGEGWHERPGADHAEVAALACRRRRRRRDRLRQPRAVLPSRAHAALHRGADRCRRGAGGGGGARPVRRRSTAGASPRCAAAGVTVDVAEGEVAVSRAPSERGVPHPRPAGPAPRHLQGGGQPRRPHGHPGRRVAVDLLAREPQAGARDGARRFEAVAVGIGTAVADDPLLTARERSRRRSASRCGSCSTAGPGFRPKRAGPHGARGARARRLRSGALPTAPALAALGVEVLEAQPRGRPRGAGPAGHLVAAAEGGAGSAGPAGRGADRPAGAVRRAALIGRGPCVVGAVLPEGLGARRRAAPACEPARWARISCSRGAEIREV